MRGHGAHIVYAAGILAGLVAVVSVLAMMLDSPSTVPGVFLTPGPTSAALAPTATPVRLPTPTELPRPVPTPTSSPVVRPTPTPRSTPAPVPTPTPTPTIVPALDELALYTSGKLQQGFEVDSWNFPLPDPGYTDRTFESHATLGKDLFVEGDSGEFMSVYSLQDIDLDRFTHVRFTATAISGPGAWIGVTLATDAFQGSGASQIVHIPLGKWQTFTIPLEDLMSPGYAGGYVGIGFTGEPGPYGSSTNPLAFADIRLVRIPDVEPPVPLKVQDVTSKRIRVTFSEAVNADTALDTGNYVVRSSDDPVFSQGVRPVQVLALPSNNQLELILDREIAGKGDYTVEVSDVEDNAGNAISRATGEFSADVRQATLTVDASSDVHPFSPKIRGVAMNTWNWIYGDLQNPASPKRAAVLEAAKALKPGIVRFAGGLWVNGTGWDRSNTKPEDGDWIFANAETGQQFTYRHTYRASLIDSYASFVKELGAESIIQVNICDNNPEMWADLVRYTNVEHNYQFRYWELGNEIDLDGCTDEQGYSARFIAYSRLMKAVDPSIKIIGPSPSMPYYTGWYNALYSQTDASIDVLSFHWYQLTEWNTNPNSFGYQGGSVDALLSYNQAVGTSCNEGFGCPGDIIPLGRLDRISYRRGMPEAVKEEVISRYLSRYPEGEVALTETGPHASLHEHPINGNHLAAIWLADMLGRWAYNGLDILTYYSLEDGGMGTGNTRGLLGIDDAEFTDVRPTYYSEWLYAQHFGDMMVYSSTTDEEQKLVVWASRDTSDPNALKLILVNLGDERAKATVNTGNFVPSRGEAYVMTSTDPTSLDNPDSFANHQTSINGVQIPDVPVNGPGAFTQALASVQPVEINAGAEFEYSLEPYSVAAITLYR